MLNWPGGDADSVPGPRHPGLVILVGQWRLCVGENLPKVPSGPELSSVSLSATLVDMITGKGGVGGQHPDVPIGEQH